MLTFNPKWRFQPPEDGVYRNSEIPEEAIWEFDSFIGKVATQENRWNILEKFKETFSQAIGQSHYRSSSESWAESDLSSVMTEAAKNAPLFLEAFYKACKNLNEKGLFAPDVKMINQVCEKYKLGYFLQPPELIFRENSSELANMSVFVNNSSPTLAERAVDILQTSLARSEQLLSEGYHREAVQETLWVLESVATTAFSGLETDGKKIKGKYFNKIVDDLRRLSQGTTLAFVLEWMKNVHGFLSSPTGGGIRHGLDLNKGISIGQAEARLFCNLIRSYTGYLLAEHERLTHEESKNIPW